jgi:hypothetical protein
MTKYLVGSKEILWFAFRIEERLPSADFYVLTFSPDSIPQIRIHFYSTVAKQWNKNTGGRITHWMALPFPPEVPDAEV